MNKYDTLKYNTVDESAYSVRYISSAAQINSFLLKICSTCVVNLL